MARDDPRVSGKHGLRILLSQIELPIIKNDTNPKRSIRADTKFFLRFEWKPRGSCEWMSRTRPEVVIKRKKNFSND